MQDDELLDGMSEEELDAILESDDPDQIEAMLDGKRSKDKPADADEDASAEAENATNDEESENKTEEKSAASSAEDDESKQDGKEVYVEGKSGVSKIPYSVLENTRTERNQLRSQLEEAQSKLSQLESQSQKTSRYLEENGIDLSALERGETLDEEQMAALKELDPAIEKLARVTMNIVEQQKVLANQVSENSSNQVNPVDLAIEKNADLSSWRKSDTDRWETACQYDDLLKQDPAYKNSSLSERFAEAVLRTKKLFGDSVTETNNEQKPNRESAEQIAAAKIAAATSKSVPRSLTDMGAAPTTERSKIEVIGDLDGDALVDAMLDMSGDQLDRLLASGYGS